MVLIKSIEILDFLITFLIVDRIILQNLSGSNSTPKGSRSSGEKYFHSDFSTARNLALLSAKPTLQPLEPASMLR